MYGSKPKSRPKGKTAPKQLQGNPTRPINPQNMRSRQPSARRRGGQRGR
jgi:hypothetical protein